MGTENSITSEDLIKWCDEMAKEGNLEFRWDGGGDSGAVDLYLNDTVMERDDEMVNILIDMMYDNLDYGSWAGEFSARGNAPYNPETKSFNGVDIYSETDVTQFNCKIKVEIPADIWFDSLRIITESNSDSGDVSVGFMIRNGFVTQRHDDLEVEIEKTLNDKFGSFIYKKERQNNVEYALGYNEWNITRGQFTKIENHLEFVIEELNLENAEITENGVVLSLKNDEDDE